MTDVFKRIKPITFFWIAVFAVVLLQHCFVWMYFDDYGYASLTYIGGDFNSTGGTDYSLSDVFRFLVYHYQNWGGRVLGFLVEILCLQRSIWLMRISQSVVLFLGIYYAVKLLCKGRNWSELMTGLFFVGMYLMMGLSVLNWGTYWFSASVSYVWSISFMLIGMYFQECYRDSNKTRDFIIYVFMLSLSAGFYEQASVAILTYVFVTEIAWPLLGKGPIGKSNLLALGLIAISSAFCIFSPGNAARAASDQYAEFYSLSLFGRFMHNLSTIMQVNLSGQFPLIVIYVVAGCLAGVLWLCAANVKVSGRIEVSDRVNISDRTEDHDKISVTDRIEGPSWIKFLSWTWLVVTLAISATFIVTYKGYSFKHHALLIEVIWAAFFSLNVLIYYLSSGNIRYAAVFLAGLFSQGMMFFAPQLNFRIHIPFFFVMIFVCTDIIVAAVASMASTWKWLVAVVVMGCGLFYASKITYGYYCNNAVMATNDRVLRAYATDSPSFITLYKLIDDRYACVMPYQEGFEFGEVWMKNYYAIPQEVNFNWVEYTE